AVESLGGDVPSVKISAKTGKGIDDLLDLIILVSEMKDLKANAGGKAEGVIIESYLDNKRGPTATLLINEGTLEPGDIVGTSFTMGKIKILEDFQGTQLEKAMPGDPAVVLGFEDAPRIGENFREFSSLAEAQENVQPKERREISTPEQKPESDQKVLNIILKTDVLGSIEAVKEILQKIPQEKVALNLLRAEVGNITQNDVKLAQSSKALILGFRVDINKAAERLLQREETSVEVMTFNIIYELVEGVKKTVEKGLEPEIVRTDVAKLKVLKTFWSKKRRQIVGGRIIEGTVKKGLSIEVTREEEVIDQGKIIDLQKKKQPIRQASKGEEVGLLYEGEKKIEKDDVLVFFKKERKKATL
ncbi:MAG: hypothetical protein GF370_01865, partial [Candidatus Nealsonbacteria bacterium]|nr:hypothetical protein [Candidatus Nealsonbacteria bacterium]